MRRIILEAVPQSSMRPPYCSQESGGDWFIAEKGDLAVRVIGKDLDNPETLLFALHELVEAVLSRARGITQEAVDDFDRRYAAEPIDPDYPWAPLLSGGEPGDHPSSPYRREHRFAMLIEHLMAHELGVAGYGRVE